MMRLISAFVMSAAAAATVGAHPGPRYLLTDLGRVGPAGTAIHISNIGVVSGTAQAGDGSMRATVWFGRRQFDLGVPGLGGPNSIAYASNAAFHVVGGAETEEADPTDADFCGFKAYGVQSSSIVCAPFRWSRGVMTALPTLGGRNGSATQINRSGVIAGEVENGAPDPGCPQRLQFKPVTWQKGRVHELATYPGDPDAVAYAINDRGQVVGSTGTCGDFNPIIQAAMHPLHARLWQPDGTAVDIESLGGSGYGVGNLAINLNDAGHVVGVSDLPGDAQADAFLWMPESGTRDLGTLPGDVGSSAVGINDDELIVGLSVSPSTGPRAVIWQNGEIADLNALVGRTRFQLLLATSVNASGEITGVAVDKRTGDVHVYVAEPIHAGARLNDADASRSGAHAR